MSPIAVGTAMPRVRRPAVLGAILRIREILRLALPAVGALVAEPLFLLADSAIVGHLGTPQLAGLGIAGAVLATLVNVWSSSRTATTAAVARDARSRRPSRRDAPGHRRLLARRC